MSAPSEVNDARRLGLIATAQRQWIDALTDLGGRNTLLYYKDRRAGTLDHTRRGPTLHASASSGSVTFHPLRVMRYAPWVGYRWRYAHTQATCESGNNPAS